MTRAQNSSPGDFRPSLRDNQLDGPVRAVRELGPLVAAAPVQQPRAVNSISKSGSKIGPKSGYTRIYVATWAMVGLASSGYLGFVALNGGGKTQQALASLQGDVKQIKSSVAEIDARERVAVARINTIESRIGGISASAANIAPPQVIAAVQAPTQPQVQAQVQTAAMAPPATPPPAVAAPSVPGIALVTTRRAPPPAAPAVAPPQAEAAIPVPSLTSTDPQRPTRIIGQAAPADHSAARVASAPQAVQPKIIRVPAKTSDAYTVQANPAVAAASGIDTGSTTPAVVKPSGPRALQLGSGPSLEAVKLNWNVLSQAHSPVLGSLEPRILPSADGRAFRLLAGPFTSDADAQKACAQLKARGVSCRSTEYSGAPL
ncbi:MAG: SPOR domain-containing protein, partial [Hyphomicrobiaceae bacterium]